MGADAASQAWAGTTLAPFSLCSHAHLVLPAYPAEPQTSCFSCPSPRGAPRLLPSCTPRAARADVFLYLPFSCQHDRSCCHPSGGSGSGSVLKGGSQEVIIDFRPSSFHVGNCLLWDSTFSLCSSVLHGQGRLHHPDCSFESLLSGGIPPGLLSLINPEHWIMLGWEQWWQLP